MAETQVSSDILASNPTLDVNGTRFGSGDGVNINRTVAHFSRCIPFYKVAGQGVDVRGHKPATSGPTASFYDETATGTPVISGNTPYIIDTAGAGASPEISFKHLAAAIELRDFSSTLLSSGQYPYEKLQRQALRHAVWQFWNQKSILGNSTAAGEFDGLDRLVTLGLGQSVSPANADVLKNIDEAMDGVRAHGRRVDLMVMNYTAMRKLIELLRNKGVQPEFRLHRRLRMQVLVYNGIPVCQNDFITITSNVTSIYFMTLGRPNGVYAIVPQKPASLFFRKVRVTASPFISLQAHLYTALVSPTSDALVKLANWSVA
ncbi:hypothetical protein ACNOYE_18740 [Nannocystaceae bacterium ST9]